MDILMDILIKAVNGESRIIDDLLAIANDDNEWTMYYNFLAKQVPDGVIAKDPFLTWLRGKHNFIAGVIRMEPFQQYDWHVDTRRGVGINMPLEQSNSIVFFADPSNVGALVKPIFPIAYEPNRYHVFNTQVPHNIINLNSPRHLFTIEFEKDKDSLTYNDMVDLVKEYNPT